MRAGQRVTVYEDPITRQVVEGEALLMRPGLAEPDEGMGEWWEVMFYDKDGELEEQVVSRWVADSP